MASYQDSIGQSLKYFKDDELAASVFVGKYALTDNNGDIKEPTPDHMHRRLAKEFARIEKKYPNPLSEEEIYELLKNFEFVIPQGSPMNAIGNDYQIQSTSNCFVIEPCYDSYGGILKTDQEQVQLMKRRGGVGHDVSNIRPKGLNTNNAAKTTDGIGVFLERFSNSCREVAQGGRRGALMLTISIHHPEIETFINIKRDKTKVTGANISIRLTDEFMKAVKDDGEYELRFPVDSSNPIIKKNVKAKLIWNQIIDAAWESAEPGLLYWDTAIKNTPSDIYSDIGFKSTATNPCLPSWTKLLTKDGIKELKDINIGDFIWSKEGWTKVINKWSTGIKKVFKYKTSSASFYGTENHKIVSNGQKVEVKNAETIDVIRGHFSNDFIIDPQDVMDGLMIGDGSVHKASNNLTFLLIGKNDGDYFNSEIKELILEHRPGITEEAFEVKSTITFDELPKTYDRKIPKRFLNNKNKMVGFLRGLYSANGSVCGNRITLKATSLTIIEQVQLMLNSIGIKSYITINKPSSIKFKNGEYLCKESYDLNITSDRMKFKNTIGFIQEYKNEKIKEMSESVKPEKISYEIQEVSFVSEEEVYDITVDNLSHTFWNNGCDVSNCGEIILSNYDSCRLMVVNLYSFVKNKFKKNASFDFEKYGEVVYKTQRLMDDLIDIELEQIDKILNKIDQDLEPESVKLAEKCLWLRIKEACHAGRRTGLGPTAVGDILAALGIKYGSEESIKMVEEIYKQQSLNAYRSSINLAKERGCFPAFDYKKEKNHSFVGKIVANLDPETKDMYKKYGRRNIAITTTAPTGSVSVLTQTTSGIEPAYLLFYTRRKKINPNDKDAKVDFIDPMGDKWQEYKVYHHKLKEWMEITGETDIEKSPYYKATSNDVDWVSSVKLQAAAQRWVCHAISKTCNLPNSASKELVSEVYMKAWEEGCKGFTVYRDGCRTGVLVSNESKKEENVFEEHSAPKRPKNLPCDIHQVNIKGESWTIFVGKLDNKPYEIIGGLSKYVHIPKKIKFGSLIKDKKKQNGSSVYNLVYGEGEDETKIHDIVSVFENPTEGAFTRTLSLALRHGTPIQFVVEQLQKDEKDSDMYSFSRVISRVLKHYILEGTKASDKTCENCGAENSVVYKEGCKTCSNCGHSKCG